MKTTDLSPLEIEKWYAIAVGEIGIPPTDFYQMTDEELEWAYRGYKQRQEDLVNLLLLALNRSQTEHRNELFSFVEKQGYEIGNLTDRQTTFKNLGIEEEFNDADA